MFHNLEIFPLCNQFLSTSSLLSLPSSFFSCLLDIQPLHPPLATPTPCFSICPSQHLSFDLLTQAYSFQPSSTPCSLPLTLLIFNNSHIHPYPSYPSLRSSPSPSSLHVQPTLLHFDHACGMAIAPKVLISAALLITVCTSISGCITSRSLSPGYYGDGSPAGIRGGHL